MWPVCWCYISSCLASDTITGAFIHSLGTGVHCYRVARQTQAREYKDLDAHFTANLGYSHHQKAVILDGPMMHAAKGQQQQQQQTRRIVAYVGGVDLTGECLCK